MENKILERCLEQGWESQILLEHQKGTVLLKAYLEPKQSQVWLDHFHDLELLSSQCENEYFWTQSEGESRFELTPGLWVDTRPEAKIDSQTLAIPSTSAFGDGRHPATQMAAQLMQAHVSADSCILDLGCGSGILGLCALKWGAKEVDFCDVDVDSIRVTKKLLTLNRLKGRDCFVSNLLEGVSEQYDCIVANIYGELVQEILADPQMPRNLSENAIIIFSGIHQSKLKEVLEAASQVQAIVIDQLQRDEWCALSLRPFNQENNVIRF